jgi:predicted PolB exonuclease-like 3'-5' exonuclease
VRDLIFLDLETAAIDDADQYIEPVSAPANYKDAEKIAAYIAEATEKAKDKCALDPDLGRIVALGWMHPRDQRPTVRVCRTETDEKDALELFWREYDSSAALVTFNGLRFDLPVLMRRSLYLNLRYPLLNLDKYRTPHLDLLAQLTYNGVLSPHSLKFYLARFGIAVDDVHTGKDIAQLVKDGKWDAIAGHCEADVIGTRLLATRMGLVPVLPREVAEVF